MAASPRAISSFWRLSISALKRLVSVSDFVAAHRRKAHVEIGGAVDQRAQRLLDMADAHAGRMLGFIQPEHFLVLGDADRHAMRLSDQKKA